MRPAPTKSPPLNTIRYVLWFATSFAIITAIVLGITQFYSITQFFIRLTLLIAAYFVTATLLKKFPPRPRPVQSAISMEPLTLRSLLPMVGAMLWMITHAVILGYGNSAFQLVTTLSWQFPFMIGSMLVGSRLLTRVGDSLHCPHCEYPYTFEDADAPIRCPECGKGWLGILKKGRKKWTFKNTGFGFALIFFSLLVFTPTFYIGRLSPYLPTSLLFASSYLTPTNNHIAWDELATRKLSPYWTSVMAKRVLSMREKNPYNVSTGWFEQTAAKGTISSDLQERFYVEGLQADLLVPTKVQVNVPFPAALRVTHAATGDRIGGRVLFAGYYIDHKPTAVGRLDESVWFRDLRPDFSKPHRDCLEQPITITTKGEHKIRVVYWVVYLQKFNDPLIWLPNGTPSPIPTATWMKRYEFTKTIRVE